MSTTLHTVLYGQTLLDIVTQRYGCVDGGIEQLMADNPSITSLTDTPAVGSKLVVQVSAPLFTTTNQAIAGLFAQNGTQVASGNIAVLTFDNFIIH